MRFALRRSVVGVMVVVAASGLGVACGTSGGPVTAPQAGAGDSATDGPSGDARPADGGPTDARAADGQGIDAGRDADSVQDAANDAQVVSSDGGTDAGVDAARPPMALTLAEFAQNAAIGPALACNVHMSPTLSWTAGPAGTQSYAVTLIDRTRIGTNDEVHWVAYDIPAAVRALAPGQPRTLTLVALPPAKQVTSFDGLPGYFGPCPPPGDAPHIYDFQVWALDVAQLSLDPALTGKQVAYAQVQAHQLEASPVWSGTYAR